MKVIRLFWILLLITLGAAGEATEARAQQKRSFSGYIKDKGSGEALMSATLYVRDLGIGTQSNTYGFFSLSLEPGQYQIIVSYVGFQTRELSIDLVDDLQQTIELQRSTQLEEVEITSRARDAHIRGTEMGTIQLSTEEIKVLPVLFGESDILKALQLMPGVQSAGEGISGFYVRGGGPDQNLVLLDDAVVYNTGHLFGFFSVFNTDAIRHVELIKGGMPANYGGRLSSVVDVSMKEGNNKAFHARGGIGLIASRLTLEGPLKKEKGSFMISGRRTYVDVLMKPFVTGNLAGSGYFFYDANLKANYQVSEKDRLFLSGYFGRDKFRFQSQSGNFNADIPWGNATATLRWNHLFNSRLFMNTTAVYNDYQFEFGADQNAFAFRLASGIRDWSLKSDLDYYSSFHHRFKAGMQLTHHRFVPNQISGRLGETELMPANAASKNALEAGIYLMDQFDPHERISINLGIRYSVFAQLGPHTEFHYGAGASPIDSTVYASGQSVKTYGGWEPRLQARYSLDDHSSIKASLARSYQYIHLVTNNGSTLPTDLWVPSTLMVKPQQAWQYALGYFRNFSDNRWETSLELYYKSLKNQVEYREGYVPSTIQDPEMDFVFGEGEAYGAEVFLRRTRGRWTGWLGYTLSWTYRRFPDLNRGMRYPAKYDRRHDLSFVASYAISPTWTVSGVFIYGSGNAITLPTQYYFLTNATGGQNQALTPNLVPQYSDLNAYRLFPYHRLDLSAVYTPKPKKNRKWKSSWAFSLYNVYSRQNPYFLYVDTEGDLNEGIQAKVKQVSLFPILPSVTYNFEF